MFAFQAKYLPVLDVFAARGDIRWYLNGYCVAPHPTKGVLLKATNGHVAIVIHDEEGTCEGQHIIARNDQLVRACRPRRKDALNLWVTWAGARSDRVIVSELSAGTADAESPGKELWASLLPAPIVDGQYPKFERVIPNEEDLEIGMNGTVNAAYLAKLEKAGALLDAAEFGRSSGKIFAVYAWSEKNGAYAFQFSAHPNVLILIMPMFDERATAHFDRFRDTTNEPAAA